MKVTLFTFLIFIFIHSGYGQRFLVDSKESDSLSIKEIKSHTSIIGNLGITKYTIEVFNHSTRQLSGELQFPLSDHQTIIGYALDINGKLRNAVAVDKVKGRAAFENIVSRSIDPALLEKTDGNNFKTRIYPIPPKRSRIIQLEILDNLIWKDGTLNFKLSLNFKEKVQKKEVQINFIGFTNELKLSGTSSFTKKKEKGITSIMSTSSKKVHITILPKRKKFAYYQKQKNDFFYYYNSPIPKSNKINSIPKSMTILWDQSLSRKGLVHKEIEFIKSFCKQVKKLNITLVLFNTGITTIKKIKIRRGNTKKIEKILTTISYDGATQYGKIQEFPVSDINILCSDGISNFGDTTFKSNKAKIFTVTSQTANNPAKLKVIAKENGGAYINLNNQSTASTIALLIKNATIFYGYKEKEIQESYPKSNSRISTPYFSAIAKGNKLSTISPVFNLNNNELKEIQPVEIKQSLINLKRLLAIEKIKELSLNPKENKEQLLRLGLTHNLITDYTSLIVLETLEDYIENEIVPPNPDWKKQYYSNYKLAKLKKQENKLRFINHQLDDLSELLIWAYPEQEKRIDTLFEKREDELDLKEEKIDDEFDVIEERLDSLNALHIPKQIDPIIDENYKEPTPSDLKIKIKVTKQGDLYLITGVAKEDGIRFPGVDILIVGTTKGTYSDFDGNFSLKVPLSSKISFRFLGFDSAEQKITTPGEYSITMPVDSQLEEVVITSSFSGSTYKNGNDFLKNTPNIDEYQIFKGKNQLYIKKKDHHVILGKQPLVFIDYEAKEFSDIDWENGEDKLGYIDWNEIFSLEIIPKEASLKLVGSLAKDGVIFAYTKDFVEDDAISIPIKFNKHIKHVLSKKVWTNIPSSLKNIAKYRPKKRYQKYLELVNRDKKSIGFYMAAGNLFTKDAPKIAVKIWSNIAEIQLENHENIRTLAYLLRSIKQYKEAIPLFEKILELRPDEPITHRDLAITYGLNGNYKKAIKILKEALEGSWIERNRDPYNYTEVMNTIYNDYNSILQKQKTSKKEFMISGDLRIVLTWTSSDTDIDLHLITPSGKDFYYRNDESDTIRYNTDIRNGYGPEEILVKKAEKGTYSILVDFFADRQQTIHGPVGLSIEIYKYFGTDKEVRTERVLTLTKEAKNVLGATIKF